MVIKLFFSILLYFMGLIIFLTNQFVSYQSISQNSQNSLLQYPNNSSLDRNIQNVSTTQSQIQVILIVIDALRFDYIQKLKFFKKAANKYPNNTFIKKVRVGNPTMTTQRIQSLMTGSQLFTATNILQMFLAQTIPFDNLINQLYNHGKLSAVMGDDTWIKLFGSQKFNQSYVCDSTFNIKDYSTCDKTIYDNFQRIVRQRKTKSSTNTQLNQNQSTKRKFDFIIAHFLSLDHIGHSTSSILSKQMIQKMNEMSIYFDFLLETVQNNTMILITGDHGMRTDGNHGGTTKEQIETLLFAFYKGQTKNNYFNTNSFIDKNNINTGDTMNVNVQYLNQIDITSTLSLLLDVPTPANNIGYPIIQILPQRIYTKIANIQIGMLQQYAKIISYYELNSPSCLQNLNQIRSRIRKYRSSIESFKHYNNEELLSKAIQRREYLKIQVNQKCLSQLSFTHPNYFALGFGILIMIIGFSIMLAQLISFQSKQIKLIQGSNYINLSSELKSNKKFHASFLMKIVSIVDQHLNWLLSLFTIYFSWYFIRNQSTYLFLLICCAILLSPFHIVLPTSKITSILLLILLSQLQPDKINEYQVNLLRVQTFNDYVLSKGNGVGVGVWICSLAFIWQYKVGVKRMKQIKHSQTNQHRRQKQSIIICLCLMFLVYIDQMIYYFGLKTIYELKNFTIACLCIYFLYVYVFLSAQNNISTLQIVKDRQILIVVLLLQIMVLAKNATIFILLVVFILDQVNKVKVNIILTYLVCQYFWWILGNRYEYSSIDIKKSYVFTQDFYWFLNAFCLCWYFLSPYLIGVFYIKYKQQAFSSRKLQDINQRQQRQQQQLFKVHKQIQEEQKQLTTTKQTQVRSQNQQIKIQSTNKDKNAYINMVKWLVIIFSGLISCCINLTINNQKILFTVVYVPLTILSTLKAILLTILGIFLI